MHKVYHITGIEWDATDEEVKEHNLPPEMLISLDTEGMSEEEIEEALSDAITDDTDFCHYGFDFKEEVGE